MKLNTLSPAPGSKFFAKRVGRGIGSGIGKTSGRGHKGQKARAGGYNKIGFEGGQMPLQRRLPKFGFTSQKAKYVSEVRLHELNMIESDIINIDVLKQSGIVRKDILKVRIIASGKINKAVSINSIYCTKGAKLAIESAGGQVE